MKKSKYCFCVIAFSFFAFSYQIPNIIPTNPNEKKSCSPINERKRSPRIQVQGEIDFFIAGSFLYLQPQQEGMELGIEYFPQGNRKMIKLPFDYTPAFKVSGGMNFGYDNWGMLLSYSRIHINEKKKISASNSNVFRSFWGVTRDFELYLQFISKWQVKMDFLYLGIDKPYFIGKKLILQPSFGLIGGWLNQVFEQNEFSTIPSHNDVAIAKSKSWFIGPKVEIDPKILLGKGFYFWGKGAVALYYQNIQTRYADFQMLNTIRDMSDHKGVLNLLFESGIGLGWGKYFSNHYGHFNIQASFDYLIFTNQNEMRYLLDCSVIDQIDGNPGDLNFKGLNLEMRFDF